MTVRITRDDATASDLRRQSGRVKDGRISRRLLAIALVLEGRRERSRLKAAEWIARPFGTGFTVTMPKVLRDCATVVEVG